MIRSTLTAHLAENDKRELTVQMNDRDVGPLATQRRRHYVASGNRRVQMIAGFFVNRSDSDASDRTRYQLRLWQSAFRTLQVSGTDYFLGQKLGGELEADFLFLMTQEMVLIFCERSLGIYLHRGSRLYRQQPTMKPDVPLNRTFEALDFYAFRPREGDNLLIIAPEFIDLFQADELEEMFGDLRQVNVSMAELTSLADKFGYTDDTSWFSVQIQRLGEDEALLSEPISETHEVIQTIVMSKVVPLRDGNVRILPPGLSLKRDFVGGDIGSGKVYPAPPKFTSAFTGKPRALSAEAAARRRTADRASHKKPSVSFWDRVKLWNADRWRRGFGAFHHRMRHLFPESRGLSLLAYLAILCVVILVVAFLFHSLLALRHRPDTDTSNDRPVVTGSPTTAATEEKQFEIEIEIRANTLRVMAAPESKELVATLKRGDRVIQTAEPVDGWVRIELKDGRRGYVRQDLLAPGAAGD